MRVTFCFFRNEKYKSYKRIGRSGGNPDNSRVDDEPSTLFLSLRLKPVFFLLNTRSSEIVINTSALDGVAHDELHPCRRFHAVRVNDEHTNLSIYAFR